MIEFLSAWMPRKSRHEHLDQDVECLYFALLAEGGMEAEREADEAGRGLHYPYRRVILQM